MTKSKTLILDFLLAASTDSYHFQGQWGLAKGKSWFDWAFINCAFLKSGSRYVSISKNIYFSIFLVGSQHEDQSSLRMIAGIKLLDGDGMIGITEDSCTVFIPVNLGKYR